MSCKVLPVAYNIRRAGDCLRSTKRFCGKFAGGEECYRADGLDGVCIRRAVIVEESVRTENNGVEPAGTDARAETGGNDWVSMEKGWRSHSKRPS